jgi:SAM-dependent methyltransferase
MRHDAGMSGNDAQRDYWAGDAGRAWVEHQARMDLGLAPVTAALLARAGIGAGASVLDIGCGAGETTLALADAVGPGGHVVGADISPLLLDRARERAGARANVAFIEADAQTHRFDGAFDLLFSRFGVMFFADPTAAFRNLAAALRTGGRLLFACWRPVAENPWTTVPMTALRPILPAPAAPPDPLAPGPFAFADPARVEGILAAAGFTGIAAEAFDFPMLMGQGDDPLADAVRFLGKLGPAAAALREAGPEAREAAKPLLAAALAPHVAGGRVSLPGAIWLVSATRA